MLDRCMCIRVSLRMDIGIDRFIRGSHCGKCPSDGGKVKRAKQQLRGQKTKQIAADAANRNQKNSAADAKHKRKQRVDKDST